jgi:uroporphyrinogen decarboxylase
MMTSRERMLAAFAYDSPDRIPVVYHPSNAGLHVHGQKLLDLFNRYPPDNPIRFDSLPVPPPGTIGKDGAYHEIRTDEWGTEWEHRIFGVHGHPRSYPFASWSAAIDYKFPPLPVIDKAEVARQRERFLVFSGWVSIFEKLHALRPIDEVLMDIQMRDADLMAFLDRLVEYWIEAIELMLSAGIDTIVFADDWGTQTAPIIAPSLFREVFKPRYEKLMTPIRRANRMAFFHCCGYMGEIFDEFLDLGIKGLWPQIGLFEADASHLHKCREHGVAIYIHPDRQRLIPLGIPHEIEAKIHDYANTYHNLGGGGIFYIEIENDAPFENVRALVEAVHRYR